MLARSLPSIVTAAALLIPKVANQTPTPAGDPFAWLQPTISLSADDRRTIDHGDPIARALPGTNRELAVFAVVTVRIDAARLRAWVDRIDAFKKSQYVLAIGRFSDPPRLEDLAGLSLDDDDLNSIRDCHPGDCALKLSAQEMGLLQATTTGTGSAWRPAMQTKFRELVLDRVRAYLARGEIAPYQDKSAPISVSSQFTSLVEHLPFLSTHVPEVAASLADPPADDANVESFFYWSKERIARKAVVSVTEVRLFRGDGATTPDLLVTGKGIFATHYLNGSLGLTALVGGDSGGTHYLVYVNRSSVDVPGGPFSGMIRWFAERRLRGEAEGVLRSLRTRLESGDPPPAR